MAENPIQMFTNRLNWDLSLGFHFISLPVFLFVFRLLQLIFISNRVHLSPAVEGRRWGRVEILLKSEQSAIKLNLHSKAINRSSHSACYPLCTF